MPNPFNFGTPVPHYKFVGRWDQINAIVEDLVNSEGHSHAVIGGRRFGKSSFLEALQNDLIQRLSKADTGNWYIFPILINLKRLENDSAKFWHVCKIVYSSGRSQKNEILNLG